MVGIDRPAPKAQGGPVESDDPLLGDIYDAAAAPERWPGVIGRLCHQLDGDRGQLFMWDERLGRVFSHDHEVDPDAERDYCQVWADHDPIRRRLGAMPIGRAFRSVATLGMAFIDRDPFHQDYMLKAGVLDVAALRLDGGEGRVTIAHVTRRADQAPFSAEEAARLEHYGRHLARAVSFQQLTQPFQHAGGHAELVLDGLTQPVALLDGTGRILFANQPMDEVLRDGRGLRSRQGQLVAAASAAAVRLAELIARAAPPSGQFGALTIDGGAGLPPQRILISPLTRRLAQRASVMVTIDRPTALLAPSGEVLRDLFGLTAAEVALALLYGSGRTSIEIARLRQTTRATVRTQLQGIMAKTRCHRQAELVQLLARLASLR